MCKIKSWGVVATGDCTVVAIGRGVNNDFTTDPDQVAEYATYEDAEDAAIAASVRWSCSYAPVPFDVAKAFVSWRKAWRASR